MKTMLWLALLCSGAWAQAHQHSDVNPNGRADMQTIHALFDDHLKIKRTVTVIRNGVTAVTVSDDATVVARIQEHTWAMKKRLAAGQPIRTWDPLFAELFKHHRKIKLTVANLPNGVRIRETSTDAYVVKLIQAHAQGVTDFIKDGPPGMPKRHELPNTQPAVKNFLGKGDGVTTCPVTGEPVNRDIKFGHGGRTIYFCCESCRAAFKQNPERFLKP